MVQAVRRRSIGSQIATWFASLWEKRSRDVARDAARQGDLSPLLADAETALEETLWHFGSDHPSTARRLAALAAVHALRGDLREAELLFRRATSILWLSREAADHSEAVNLAEQLAELFRSNDRPGDARDVYTDLLERLTVLHGGNPHADVARTLDNLALTLKELGKLAAAKERHREALHAWDAVCRTPGSAERARCLTHLGNLYLEENRFDDAQPLLERAVTEWNVSKNPHDLYVIVTLSCCANLYRKTGRIAEARDSEIAAKGILALYAK